MEQSEDDKMCRRNSKARNKRERELRIDCAGDYALEAVWAMHIRSMVSSTGWVISDSQTLRVLNWTCSTGTDRFTSTTYLFDLVAFVKTTYIVSLGYGKQISRFQELCFKKCTLTPRDLKKHKAELDTWCPDFSIVMTAWQEGYWRERRRELSQNDELEWCRNHGMTKQCSKLQTSEWSRWLFWCRAEYRRRIHANIIQSCKDGKRVKGMSEGHMHWS